MADAVFVCSRLFANECQNCGGHTKAVHPDEGRGPFPGDSRFCSEECFAEFQEITERIAAMPPRVTACRSCGLDNFEHLDGCAATRDGRTEGDRG